jgi:hypothetical protein
MKSPISAIGGFQRAYRIINFINIDHAKSPAGLGAEGT